MSFFNISGFHSPPSRPLIIPSPTSPFCTSPSQLQEVTLDQDNTFSNSMGLRSPGGPMRGRSVKEFEEQLANLKKENFNLKLRIYFLEERMGVNFNLDKENIVKKNVELLVDVESLKKDVQEKHDLLCQAVKAMELEDEEHKKLVCEKDEIISEYQLEIESLKSQVIDLKAESEILSSKNCQSGASELFSSRPFNSTDNTAASMELQEKIKTMHEELTQEKENNAAIQIVLDQNDSQIKNLTSQLEETTKKLACNEQEMKEMNFRLDEVTNSRNSLQKKLVEKSQTLQDMTSENEHLKKVNNVLLADLEKERKRFEKLKTNSDQKIGDLQRKLEASLAELKKSQELVVSKSPGHRSGYTDPDSFSVQKSATSLGSPQTDPFFFPTLPSPILTPVSSPSSSVSFTADNAVDFKHIIEQLKAERDARDQKIVKLKAEQMKACKIIKSMIDSRNKTNEEINKLKQKNDELERELEGVVCKQKTAEDETSVSRRSGKTQENSMEEQSGELIEHYKALIDELDEKNRILIATLAEKDNQMKRVQEQYEAILRDLKEKEEHIVDLEFELLTVSQDKSKPHEEGQEKSIEFYLKQLKEKDEEIQRLNTKLLRRNYDLQGLVNNELWEKNREIEKLQKKQTSKILETKEQEIQTLQENLNAKEKQLSLIKEKISELGIDVDVETGGVSVENNLQIELEKSEKMRCETAEVCSVLSRRLEELAIFLDSLLKQKSVLGLLGNKENKRLRQIIDQSLDLSRSFTMSMMINPEQSLLQLSNISSLLNDSKLQDETNASQLSLFPSNMSLTYRSHLLKKDSEDNSQIIQTLRQQIVNLKYELQLRDVELNKMSVTTNFTEGSSDKEEQDVKANLNTTSTTLKYKSDNQSESEAWSEPDRTVSRARMGLVEASLRSSSSKKTVSTTSDSTEEDDLEKSSKGSSKKGVLNESRSTILDLHKQVCELDQKLSEKEIAFYDVSKVNNKLRQEIANLEVKLEDIEAKKREADAKREEAEAKAEQLQREKDALLETVSKKDKDLQDKINQIEVEKWEALDVAKEAEREMKAAELKILEMQQQMKDFEENLEKEYNIILDDKVQTMEEETLKKITEIQNAAELEIKTLHTTIQQLQQEYATNYVKKTRVEEVLGEIGRLKNDVEVLEVKIEEMKEEKEHAVKKLVQYEEKINLLRSDLDNATLQYSEAVLEKTKIANERALMEQEMNRSVMKEMDSKKRLDQVENELFDLKQSHQKQISILQAQKSKLEVRISELESSNAELHNRLVKIQTGCGDVSSSLPNAPNFVNQIVAFRRQHSDHSGFLSEDQILFEDMRGNRSFNRLMPNQNFDIERNEANSSPDLGIESDHGRFSSLETQLNVQRPLLQTLELTESMNNLLDVERNEIQAVNCDNNDHCCQKSLEMAHENSDLKRKLLRTRRALEETVTQLTLANQRKKQVEKTICRQIHKTSQVLRKAKANLDSGSETDVYKQ